VLVNRVDCGHVGLTYGQRLRAIHSSAPARRRPHAGVHEPRYSHGFHAQSFDRQGRYHDTVCMSIVTTASVAKRLHITPRQVQRLVTQGALMRPARGVLDATSVDRYAALSEVTRRTPWAPHTAWAAVALLSGTTPTWLGPSQQSRLRARLRALTPDELVERARLRARPARYSAHRSTLPRLRPHVIEPSEAGLGLAARTDALDGYVTTDDVARLVTEHGLREDAAHGQVVLRATSISADVVRALASRGPLAALDLATSLDPRERRAGLTALQDSVDRFRGT